MLHVETHAYCGMLLPHGQFGDLAEARQRVAQRLRWLRRQGCPITKLNSAEWEVSEPEDCFLIPDYVGVLCIRHEEPEEIEDIEPDDFWEDQ